MTVMAHGQWKTNAELISDVARLGYLKYEWDVLDPTYGKGNFWTIWRPRMLVGSDLHPEKTQIDRAVDFTDMPWMDETFDAVVFDPPYKMNGTPSLEDMDEAFGVNIPTRWQDRISLIEDGVRECIRVLRPHSPYSDGGFLLVKCKDQVVSGQKVWQTDIITKVATDAGLRKVDRFDMPSYMAQPGGTSQVHSRSNTSQLLVFRKK